MNGRRNIYPMDPRDPNLKWCNTCDFPYMPASGCKVHEGRCLTCCAATYGATCWSSNEWVGAPAPKVKGDIDPAQVQTDIDALYGKDGER